MREKILVLHGPNLHLLGKREPDIYGKVTLETINQKLKKIAKKFNFSLTTFQSNQEGKLIDKITGTIYDLLVINPAAYTHTSIAIRDAIAAIKRPVVEVHLSNIYQREAFRAKSLISPIVTGTIGGFGENSYYLAIEAAAVIFEKK